VLVIALAAFGATGAQVAPPKVNVCHVPPGDPENFHTIKINESALAAHLAHGDVAGACNERCAELMPVNGSLGPWTKSTRLFT